MLARLAPLVLALVACAPSPEPRDAAPDRRISRPDAAPDVEEPRFEDVFFPTLDAPSEVNAPDSESDATAPDDRAAMPDSAPDSSPDARPDARPDAGSDARDATPDVCPAPGFMDVSTWAPCGAICCPSAGACGFDINGRPFCS